MTLLTSNKNLKNNEPFTTEEHLSLFRKYEEKKCSLENYYILLTLQYGYLPELSGEMSEKLLAYEYSAKQITVILERCKRIVIKSRNIFNSAHST